MTRYNLSRNQIEWVLLGISLLVLGAMLGYWIYSEHGAIEAQEGERLQVQARIVSENLGRQLEGVNNALGGVRDDLPQWNGKSMSVAPSRRLKVLTNAMPGVRTLLIMDAEGTVLDSSRIEVIGQNFSEREYFKVPRARPDPAMLYVSSPFKTTLGMIAINVTRALAGPTGEFAGIVAATLDPEYFSVLLRSVLYAPDMRAVVAHWDGKAFLFMPEREGVVGTNLDRPDSFSRRHRESGKAATLFTGTSINSGDERMMATRTVEHTGLTMDKPLVIHVSRNLSVMLAPWRAQSLAYGVFYALFAVVALISLYLVQKRRREMDKLAAAQDQERRESSERLELALAGGDLGLWDWHVPSGRMMLNDRWGSMLGYQPAEIEPHIRTWEKLVHPGDAPSVSAELDNHFKGKTPGYQTEHRLRHKDGRWIWILDRGKVMERDATGAPVRMVGTYMDITERKRAEEEIIELNRDFVTFLDNTSDFVYYKDANSRFRFCSQALADITGHAGWRDMIGKHDLEVFPKDTAQIYTEEEGPVFREGRALRNKIDPYYDAAGNLGWVSTSKWPVLDHEGEVVGLFGISRDVTERMAVEHELRKSVALRELLSEAMPLPVFYKDAAGRYTGCNSAFERFIGKAKIEIIGKTVFEVSQQSFAKTYRDKDLDLLSGPVSMQTYESTVAHADGSVHDVIFHKARIADETGKPTGIVGVITDITGLKQIEAKRDHLEAQLRESQKMQALGTLAGGVAHDFNNIVAAIMGNVELARQDVGPGHAALESLEEIRKASRRAKELVQQILAFGRRQQASREVISLAPVVEESVRLLRTTLPAGVELKVELDPTAPAVLADATQVEQVLLNLCANAWHAIQNQGRPGLIEIRLQAHERSEGRAQDEDDVHAAGELRPDRYACISVQDNGTGMDKETLARMFEPFFTTKPVGKGTGLGLSVVHGIVHDHGASIEVDSVPGEGSIFSVYFPEMRTSGQSADTRTAEAPPAHGQGKRVLYVDDDESIVFLMTRLLERQGYRVGGYTDARAALAAARADPAQFDLAVTDFNMPGMSGLDLARALREIRADLPIAVASGYITDALRDQAPAAGVSELIYKPNTAEELCEAVARLARSLPA